MRWSYLVICLAGCGFQSSAGAPVPDAPLPIPDGGVRDMRNLGPTELQAGQLIDMTFDGVRGSLTPSAYTYGGLIAHGLAGMKLWDHDHTTWMSPATANATVAGLWRGDSFGTLDDLTYVGVSNDQTMTVWFEGEVWLDATSTETFGLTADDVAFIDLGRPGMAGFTRVMQNDTPTAAVATPDTGWYPIRIGFANGDGTLGFAFTHSDSAAGTQVAWTRDRLRARGSELSGALRTVFAHQILGGGGLGKLPISHVDDGSLMQTTTFDTPPQGASSDNQNWSARYAAQAYIAQKGSYTLKVTSDDGNEVWFGGQAKNSSWSFGNGSSNSISTVTANLDVGWNDVIVDYNQVGGGRKLQVTMTGGGLNADIPRAMLRPVEPALDRLAFGSDDTPHLVQDNGGPGMPGTAILSVDAYGGSTAETVTAIDVTYEVDEPHWGDLRFDLETPAGKRVNIASGGAPDGDSIGQTSIAAGTGGTQGQLLGGPASGTWKLHCYDVHDSGPGNVDGMLKSAKLTLHTTGGPDRIARTASWTSQVIDATSNVIAIDSLTWTARAPNGAGVQVRLRGCQQVDCSDGPAWSGPVTSGMPFAIIPARYLQLQVAMTSDGSHEPELQSLALMFRRSS